MDKISPKYASLDNAILQCLRAGRKSARELDDEKYGLLALAMPFRKESAWYGGFMPASGVLRDRLQALRVAGLIQFDGAGWRLTERGEARILLIINKP